MLPDQVVAALLRLGAQGLFPCLTGHMPPWAKHPVPSGRGWAHKMGSDEEREEEGATTLYDTCPTGLEAPNRLLSPALTCGALTPLPKGLLASFLQRLTWGWG